MGSQRDRSNLTEFRRWRERCGYTLSQAAEALGLSLSRVTELDSGKSRRVGGPSSVELDRRTRLAMAAVLEDLEPYRFEAERETVN